MGQKIHPVGFRVGVIRGWDSNWFAGKKGYSDNLVADSRIRRIVKMKYGLGNIARVEIERAATHVKVNIFTPRPGAVIGRGGRGIDELTGLLMRMERRRDRTAIVQVNVTEVRQPEVDAQLVAENIAAQLEKRVSHRRAMRQAMTRCLRMNGRGIKIQVSGRLNGAEIARTEKDMNGKVPLHTLRADIDFGVAEAHTIYGSVGVKVWVYRGEVLPERRVSQEQAPARRRRGRDEAGAVEVPTVRAESKEADTHVDA